ncbi:MAG: hypothetical protein EU549_03165 [Promethearchaeota archaeon]|nr:MAG: hypothetical protein EU549_03165 [Candidatus Lokiarchaeota archaeon]
MNGKYMDLRFDLSSWEKIINFFSTKARPLEQAQFNNFFGKINPDKIFSVLKPFQNHDGGFGHGIEPDFHLPDSTPMGTSLGLRILDQFPDSKKRNDLIMDALKYLKGQFDSDRKGWYAVNKRVNEFPHAPWWRFDLKKDQTIIDKHWGNPTAELLGYCWTYREFFSNWQIEPKIEYAIHYLEKKDSFPSEHEIYCFLHMYHHISASYQKRIKKKLTTAVQELVIYDKSQWKDYAPQPVHFLVHPEDSSWGLAEQQIYKNLKSLHQQLMKEGHIRPTWEWGQYTNHWALAKKSWSGILTLRALKILKHFNKQLI